MIHKSLLHCICVLMTSIPTNTTVQSVFLTFFDGRTPVIFYLTDTKRKVKAPSSMWVDINPVMIKELKYQLGDENVVAK